MKAGTEHRVPLTAAAVKLLKALPRMEGSNLVFPAPRGGELSDMTLTAVIKRMHAAETKAGRKGYLDPKQHKTTTAHGFRSTFRDWAAEHTSHPHDVVEMALAHTITNKVEAAYRRGDLFQKRRALMDDWACLCLPKK
jgi:integrase